MERPRSKGFIPTSMPGEHLSFSEIVQQLPTRTKIGGICLLTGKLVGLLAIPAVFFPSLRYAGIILVIIWGGLIFTAIVLCSYEHFQSARLTTASRQAEEIKRLLSANPALREEISRAINEKPGKKQECGESAQRDTDRQSRIIRLDCNPPNLNDNRH